MGKPEGLLQRCWSCKGIQKGVFRLLLTKDFMISVYNLLEYDSDFRSDLMDLFGTPDGSKTGFIGSSNKPLCWDWGETGFRKIINIIYVLSGGHSDFEEFYKLHFREKQRYFSL